MLPGNPCKGGDWSPQGKGKGHAQRRQLKNSYSVPKFGDWIHSCGPLSLGFLAVGENTYLSCSQVYLKVRWNKGRENFHKL